MCLSFVNYYFFYIIVFIFTSLESDELGVKKCRFIFALFIALFIFPYYLGLNIYGGHVFKEEYFGKV